MAAAYGPQDKIVRAAYVAINLQLLGHGVAERVEQIARSLAALGLLAMGLSALVAPRLGRLVGSRCSSVVAGESQPAADAARGHPASTQRG